MTNFTKRMEVLSILPSHGPRAHSHDRRHDNAFTIQPYPHEGHSSSLITNPLAIVQCMQTQQLEEARPPREESGNF